MRGIVGDRVPAELWHDLVRLEFLRHRCPLNLSTTSETEHNRAAFPVAKAVGVNEVHYAMVVILAMGIGLFAPPFEIGFFSACAIGRTNPDDSLWRI
jgi:hypothetical protein